MDNGAPRFPSSRYLRVPFVFVPKGSPRPLEWIAAHPRYVTISGFYTPPPPAEREMGLEPQPEAEGQAEPPPEETVYEQPAPEPEVEPEAPPRSGPLLYPHRTRPRPDYMRRVPPPEPRRAEDPPDFRPGLALSRGMNIGMDLCTPEGTRNLMRQTTRIMADMERFSGPVTYPTMHTPEGLSAAVRAGMQHLAAHKGDVVAALASVKAEGTEGHWAAPAQSPRAGEQSRTGITHKTAAATMWPYMEPAEDARAVVSTLVESDRQALYQLVASGDLKCQGFAGGCQNGGSFGMTGAYVVRGRILCATCATKALGYTEEPGSELPSLLAPYALYPQ